MGTSVIKNKRKLLIKQTSQQGLSWKKFIQEGLADEYGEEDWLNSFVGGFVERYKQNAIAMVRFKKAIGKKPEWLDITDENLLKFRQYMLGKSSKNRTQKLLSAISTYISDNMDKALMCKEEYCLMDYKNILTVQVESARLFYLTENEIKKIDRYLTHSNSEDFVKRVFMIMAYTGARIEDSKRMSLENCDYKSDTLTYVASGLNMMCSLPIHKNLKQYLSYREDCKLEKNQFNAILRSICFKAGVRGKTSIFKKGKTIRDYKYNLITPDIARCSFATNLYLRDADINLIAKMMGVDLSLLLHRFICEEKRNKVSSLNFFK